MSVNIYLNFVSTMHRRLNHRAALIQTTTKETYEIMDASDKKAKYFEIVNRHIDKIKSELKSDTEMSKDDKRDSRETIKWLKDHVKEIDKLFVDFDSLIKSNHVTVEWYAT